MATPQRWTTKRRILIPGGLVVALLVGWWVSAYPHGMAAAWFDHARGRFEVKTYGLPVPWTPEYRRLLRDRYGVTVRGMAGCVVSEDLVWYVRGYNEVSAPRLNGRFGKDILAECAADARAAWKLEHGTEPDE